MDLKLFFDLVPEELLDETLQESSFQKSIYINHETIFNLDGIDIVLIGLLERRGIENGENGLDQAANEIRAQLYKLKKGTGSLRILDLGNLRNGPGIEDTINRIAEVGAYMHARSILPIFIGGSHGLDTGQYLSFQDSGKLVTLLNIDSEMDLDDQGDAEHDHIANIFKLNPNYLFNYHHMAYQSYLVDSRYHELVEKLGFNAIRLGVVKENIIEMEPIVRDADIMTFDISAIQAHYCPGAVNANVYGLTGEEACQLCWYAGLNDKLSSTGFYNYDVNKDSPDRKTAFVMATMIWYFIEGFYNRKGENSFKSNDYTVYEVDLGGEPSSIRFYKSRLSEKWWMEVPNPEDSGSVFLRNRMIPCSYSDYEQAVNGNVPDRFLSAFTKMR